MNKRLIFYLAILSFIAFYNSVFAQQEPPKDLVDPNYGKNPLAKKYLDQLEQSFEATASSSVKPDVSQVINIDDIIDASLSSKLKKEQADKILAEASADKAAYSLQPKPTKLPEKTDLKILKQTIGFDNLSAGDSQWVEVYVQNQSSKSQVAITQLLVSYPNGTILRLPRLQKTLLAKSVYNIIFNFRIPKSAGGLYRVTSRVYNQKGKIQFEFNNADNFFAKGQQMTDFIGPYTIIPKSESITAKSLSIDDLKFDVSYSLGSSYVPFSLKLHNTSPIKAQNLNLSVYLVSELNPFAPIGKAIYSESDLSLAAGETKYRAGNLLLPQSVKNGFFKLLVELGYSNDPNGLVGEPNIIVSDSRLQITSILPISPADGSVVSLDQAVNFSWKSDELKLFYLEISTNPDFDDLANLTRFPNSGPTTDMSLYSTQFESTINYLLQKKSIDGKLYWRIVGLDDLKLISGFSPTQTIIYQN